MYNKVMALGVEGVPATRVVWKTALLTLGTLGFVFSLTLLFRGMRAVLDVGGYCAQGGPYEIRTPCPKGVGWIVPVSIFTGIASVGIGFLGVFRQGGPRPYVFAWSALFLALGWNFLEYGFDPPGGGTSAGWLVCGVAFVLMAVVPLVFLLSPAGARWSLWGPRPDDGGSPPPGRPAGAPGTYHLRESELPHADIPEPRGDMVDELERLATLHDRGALDDHEYEIAKDALLHDEEHS
jgi:hypothetical protein